MTHSEVLLRVVAFRLSVLVAVGLAAHVLPDLRAPVPIIAPVVTAEHCASVPQPGATDAEADRWLQDMRMHD